MGRKAKLHLSLVWQRKLLFGKRVRLFSFQFPSEITLQQCQGVYLKCTAVLSWRAAFQVTWILFESQVPYLNSDTSKASPFYCKTPDLLGEPLIFSLKLYRHLSRLQMTNSKVTWRHRYASLFLSSNHLKSWRVKLNLKG